MIPHTNDLIWPTIFSRVAIEKGESGEGAVWTQNAAFTAFATFRMAGFEKCRTIFSKIPFLGHEIFLPGTLLNLGMVFMVP